VRLSERLPEAVRAVPGRFGARARSCAWRSSQGIAPRLSLSQAKRAPSNASTFLAAADRELTGHRWHPIVPPEHHDYVGRRRILFSVECDADAGLLDAWRLPTYPPDHPARDSNVRRVALANGGAPAREGSKLNLLDRANG
jgi:hypothetical protein